MLDIIELDMGYTTLSDQYYRRVEPQAILDGARVGMNAYLRTRGIAGFTLSPLHARADGRGVVPAIERQLGVILSRYGSRVDARDLVYAAIRGEIGALHDPYSVFFTKRELTGFTGALDGRAFGGIGLVLASEADGYERVDQVFDGSPADRAGIVVGDRLVSVDGTAVDGLGSAAIARFLRGAVGTSVVLAIERAGSDTATELHVVRAAITPPDVTARVLPDGVGYLALRAFGPAAGEQVHAALAKLHAAGARAIAFDLRGNGGGYEHAAVQVASAFVPAGPIVSTQANHGHRMTLSADGSALPPLPLAVLVDGDSASASELVTGALRDRELATVIGTRTFGKGVVQTMFPLPDGSAMKVTTARYFSPGGHDIDRIGIVPSIVVTEPAGAERGVPGHDPQLDAALTFLAGQH